ncbi:plasmid partitioning protein RepB [Mycobacterium sp. KBS0706]|uniref:plasmid partitioning protein RepB n=1 Tax=Mycobacterium sp. KBS0706 TaxID=2578109 RepID=UPI00163D3E07|nr:plasmid partitioning protein RepB [Mycobacterium sp. KBS0706]
MIRKRGVDLSLDSTPADEASERSQEGGTVDPGIPPSAAAGGARRRGLDLTQVPADPGEVNTSRSRATSSVVRSFGLALDGIRSDADEARKIREHLDRGDAVVELDPGLLDPSFIVDRMAIEDDADFLALVESIREHGQEVPILVRPAPGAQGRYQVAYGHRRWRAAGRLKIPVRAVIKALDDHQLIIAQGKENLQRKDLSYIERALFAGELDRRQYPRTLITAALSTPSSEISRYLTITKAVPDHLIRAIGPAPATGRNRWAALAEALSGPDAEAAVTDALANPAFARSSSDDRFLFVLSALTQRNRSPRPESTVWKDPIGRPAVRIDINSRTTRLTVDEALAPQFGQFIRQKLSKLYEEFQSAQRKPKAERGGVVNTPAK